MGLAGAISRALACVPAGCGGVRGCAESSRKMGRTRGAAAGVRRESEARGLASRDGVQHAEIRNVPESAMAIDAARGESRDLPSRAGDDAAAATRGATYLDGPDALLPRARDGGERVENVQAFKVQELNQEQQREATRL